MNYYEISFLLCVRERLTKKIVSMGFSFERLGTSKQSSDPSFFTAKGFLSELKDVETKIERLIGREFIRQYPGEMSYLAWVKQDSARLLGVARSRYLEKQRSRRKQPQRGME